LYRDLPGAPADVVVHLGDLRLKGKGYEQSRFALQNFKFPIDRAIQLDCPIPVVVSGMFLQCAAIRRSAFEAIGGFNEAMRLYEDTTLFGCLLREGNFLFTGRELAVVHRLDHDSVALTGIERREPVYAGETYIRALETYLSEELTSEERKIVNSRLSGAIFRLARAEAATGVRRPWATLARAARVHPKPLKGWIKSIFAALLGKRGFSLLLDQRNRIDRS
jgi:hypothetical protein